MKTALAILKFAVLLIMAGCTAPQPKQEEAAEPNKILFTVNFQPGQTLRYKFVSSRDVTINWGTPEGEPRSSNDELDRTSELFEMVVSYTPLEVDRYGLATIKATCESVEARRTSRDDKRLRDSQDAVKSLNGQTFTFSVRTTGKIDDYSPLDKLIKAIGEKAFRPDTSRGRIKEPDMIADFIAVQWFMWDSLSSIREPLKGLSVGQSWNSQLPLPTPMVMRQARDVVYTLSDIRQTDKGRVAVIRSSYSPASSVPESWPKPYAPGSFMMSGKFGFLRGFQILDLQGRGEELFDIDAGRTEQHSQQYKVTMAGAMLLPLGGASPRITIDQKITMQLLEN